MFVNAVEMYQFHCALVIFQKFLHSITQKNTGLKRNVKVFSVGYNAINTSNIVDIHRYLIKETWHKIMFGFIKECLLDY